MLLSPSGRQGCGENPKSPKIFLAFRVGFGLLPSLLFAPRWVPAPSRHLRRRPRFGVNISGYPVAIEFPGPLRRGLWQDPKLVGTALCFQPAAFSLP